MNRFHRWFCRSGVWAKILDRRLLLRALEGRDMGQDILEVGPGSSLTTDILRRRFTRDDLRSNLHSGPAAVVRTIGVPGEIICGHFADINKRDTRGRPATPPLPR